MWFYIIPLFGPVCVDVPQNAYQNMSLLAHNVLANTAVPFGAYQQINFPRAKRHGTTTIIPFNKGSVGVCHVRRSCCGHEQLLPWVLCEFHPALLLAFNIDACEDSREKLFKGYISSLVFFQLFIDREAEYETELVFIGNIR